MNEISNRVKDEKHFAKTIMARYKMSNTKNKNFVNISKGKVSSQYEFHVLYRFKPLFSKTGDFQSWHTIQK